MNWIKFLWGKNTDISKCYGSIPLSVDCSNIATNFDTPWNETQNLIKQIVQNNPSPYYLLVSGGIDSQAMLYAWIKSGFPFIPVSFTYNQNYNERDLHYLKLFAEKHHITINYIDIDYFDFLRNELTHYSKTYICNSPQINLHLKFNDYFNDGTIIHSGHPIYSMFPFNNTHLALLRYKLFTGKNIIPFFFLETPELAGAFRKKFIELDSIHCGPNCEIFLSDYELKAYNYFISGFDIIPSLKLTGFERYKQYYDQFPNLVGFKEKLKFSKYKSRHVFDLLFRYPLFDINNYTEETKTYFYRIDL